MIFRSLIALVALTTAAAGKISFNDDIRPLLSNTCFRCHGPDEEDRQADLRLDTHAGATTDNDGVRAIVPGDLDASELIYRLTTDDPDEMMPPPDAGKKFTPEQVALFKQWIEEGAEYQTHWSYTKPERPQLPVASDPLIRNAVDAFVLDRLTKEGLKFAPEADRHVLIRRVSLDLTGLPPTPEEVDAFVNDQSPDAYEKLIDRLLASPAFGEHWARMWLDLARYADSAGYADDPSRTIWAYRDWVIRAFNENKPFDQFTIEQIAGDLLENATDDQHIATAFHRNTQTNNEGGTDDEEFRNVAIVDRVNTTMATWMGTTMACAQCHTHKYDPITHEEYFKMFAILNQSEDADKRDERPTLPVFTPEQKARKAELEAEIAALEKSLSTTDAGTLERLALWELSLSSTNQWLPLALTDLKATSGATFTKLDDGSVRVTGKSAQTDTYTIEAMTGSLNVTAVKLEALADETLNDHKGPGRQGNFVLNEIELSGGVDATTRQGRFVRIDLPGKSKIINIAEVQVFDKQGNNLALKGKAKQSGTYDKAGSQLAIDGDTDGNYNNGSVAHTAANANNPFWEVDLGVEAQIARIVVWNRTDGATLDRLNGFKLSLLDGGRLEVWSKTFEKAGMAKIEASLSGGQRGKFVRASSSFDQSKFTAAQAIDGDDGGHSGWAVGPQLSRDHHAVFALDKAVPGGLLKIVLKQTYGEHALGRFRLSVSNSATHALPHRIADILAVPADKRNAQQKTAVLEHFATIDPESAGLRSKIEGLKGDLAGIKPATTVPVMRELAVNKQRKTHIHLRGSHLNLGDEVTPGLPAAFNGLPKGFEDDRLGLAHWLVSKENPLTARVVANRFWEKLFGIGIVATSEEFGSQGEAPTHPELLDWLAVEFMESGWDTKALLKSLVMSHAYRQSSEISPELLERDPDNRLAARGPRFRLSAEMVRDQALLAGGLLSKKMYGAPVRPPQPDLGLKAAFGSATDWKTSEGEDKYRRGLYTTWRRSSPYPSMAAFDAPNREVCTVRRDRTNTPLQALVTLNDPVYVEAAQALARKMHTAAKNGQSANAGIEHGFRTCVARPPKPSETERLVALFKESLAFYKGDTAMATKMATEPIGPAPEGADVAELAALTLVGNVLLNLDEVLMKR